MVDARVLHRLLLVAIVAGLGFSAYSALEVLNPGLESACSVTSYISCGAVARSGLTSLGPVPDWAVGVGGFAVLLALDIPLLLTYNVRYLQLILLFALVGVAVAGLLAYIELVLIQALCPVCLGAYFSDGAVLAVAAALYRLRRGAPSPAEEGAGGGAPA